MSKKENVFLHGNNAKIDGTKTITPLYGENVITCNKTDADGNVINISPRNAVLARREVDDNQK